MKPTCPDCGRIMTWDDQDDEGTTWKCAVCHVTEYRPHRPKKKPCQPAFLDGVTCYPDADSGCDGCVYNKSISLIIS